MSAVILGGGISGLSAAYYLARMAPSTTKITLIEGKNRLGGWIESRRVTAGHYDNIHCLPKENQQNTVLFEAGPRTLRPEGTNGAILLEMIRHLDLNNDDLLSIPKSHPSAKNRYIYYQDKINKLPSDFGSFLRQRPPVLKSVPLAGLLEPLRTSRFENGLPKNGEEDESIYSFISRRFNEHTATHLMGAVIHGIYAGDVRALSLQSTLNSLYEAERTYGSAVLGMLKGVSQATQTMRERGMAARSRKDDPDWFGRMEKMSVIGFKTGMDSLPDKITAWLKQRPNVEIITHDSVQHIGEGKIKTEHREIEADHIISTLPSSVLHSLLSRPLPHLMHNPAVDVAVVNLAYPSDIKLDYDGFGFLTPHRDSKYPNPVPGTLGVVFDSNSLPIDSEHATKLTVMMGGSDWKDAFGDVSLDQLDPQVALQRARQAVSTFLGIHAEPHASMVHLQKQCIPQYLVGHRQRMRSLHHAIKQDYGHSLSVSGASYLGVSVPDCIKNSRMLVEELLVSGALGSRQKIVTGLGRLEQEMTVEEMRDNARVSKSNTSVIIKS
ncbi:oxygen-dependent protoporphyrinogen oxidase [Rhizopus stolonifer]|uniref:Protoporphyrinogen oxidase n=1 Tax=Rhizopus stolonifer TaxID=4846 RepID=A0A367KIM2_RHIST|nr:oxygen-dependent protoporphyrinogen oxidase [Rhizopus stolonifer]